MLLLLSISSCLPFHLVGQAVYDTLVRKQSVQYDMGAGCVFLAQNYSRNNSTYYVLFNFNSGASFQANAGYSLKIDRMQLEWKLGYARFAYSVDVETNSYVRGPSTSPRYSCSTAQHAGYIQLLGVTFGKERSWGTL